MKDRRCPVTDRKTHSPGLFSLFLEAPELAREVEPGQFAMLGLAGCSRPYLRRAFSIADADASRGRVEFLVKTVGVATAAFERLSVGSGVEVLSPLGNAFRTGDLAPGSRVAIVAGGVGVAPFPILLRRLTQLGVSADLYFGGRSAPDLAYRDAIHPLVSGRELDSTDDGSAGSRGRVTELLREELRSGALYSRLYACGPTPMFKALAALLKEFPIPAEFSTEAPMGCGFGVCLACVLPRPGGGYLVSCKEGPILSPERVLWEKC